MEDSKITIIDVAKLAGVSKGTVDRVVHNRGEVSRKSEEKVRRAIAELGYAPNIYASLLASKHPHVIACLMPKFNEGEYWEKIYNGFLAGGESVASLGIRIVSFMYDQYDVESFKKVSEEMIASMPSGVVMPPLFKTETLAVADRLRALDIPYVYVDTKLEENGYLAYFGMPMYRSGNLCAALLTERVNPEDVDRVAVVRIRRDKERRSDPTAMRREGFLEYMESKFPKCMIMSVLIDPTDSAETRRILGEFFTENPGIRYVVMFNSRIHLTEASLAAYPVEGRRVIGFDDLPKNTEMLRSGKVQILISQHTEGQSKEAVRVLADKVLMKKDPEKKDFYMHMDILTPLNIEDY